MSSSPIVKFFLALAIRWATRYDAFVAVAFTDVDIKTQNSNSHFFLSKNSSVLSLRVGCLVVKCLWSFDGFIAKFFTTNNTQWIWSHGITCWLESILIGCSVFTIEAWLAFRYFRGHRPFFCWNSLQLNGPWWKFAGSWSSLYIGLCHFTCTSLCSPVR